MENLHTNRHRSRHLLTSFLEERALAFLNDTPGLVGRQAGLRSPMSRNAKPSPALPLEKLSEAPQPAGLHLVVSPKDYAVGPTTEACGAVSWEIVRAIFTGLTKLSTGTDQNVCCVNVMNVVLKIMALQAAANQSDTIIQGPPLIVVKNG